MLYNDMQAALINILESDPHIKIYTDMVIVLSSVFLGRGGHISHLHKIMRHVNSVFKSHSVTRNVSISQSWTVKEEVKGKDMSLSI